MLKRMAKLEPAPPWNYLSALGAFMVMFLGLIIGTSFVTLIVTENTPLVPLVGWSIGMSITIMYIFTSRRRNPKALNALRMGKTSAKLPIIALWALGFALTFDLIGWAITNQQTLSSAELLGYSGKEISIIGWLIAIIFMVLLQPLGEELVFRGMMFPAFRNIFGAWLGFFMVIGFHTMFHFLAYQPATADTTIRLWYGAGLPFLNAIILTSVRASTGSTRASFIAHATFGAFAIIKAITFA